jgi:hypothetical protein
MLRSYRLLAAIAGVALSLSAVAACGGGGESAGGSSSTTHTGGTSTGTGGANNVTLATPPAAGAKKAPDGAGSTTFALRRVYLGGNNAQGVPDSTAWKHLGYDIDGKATTAHATDVCQPVNGAPASDVYPDGDDGIDNNYGKTLLPILAGLQGDVEAAINNTLDQGTYSVILDLQKLGTGADYNPLLTRFYLGAELGSAPKWDGTDTWKLQPGMLNSAADPTSAKVQFAAGYLVGNTWVSGTRTDLLLRFGGVDLLLHHAVITMQLDEAHQNVTKGIVSAVLDTQDLLDKIKSAAASVSTTYCDASLLDPVLKSVAAASDILKDGTQDPSKPCDGISFAFGFDAVPAHIAGVADASPPSPDPCP